MDFYEQKNGTSCFVWACANCYIFNNKEYPSDRMIYDAMEIAKCFDGSTIEEEAVCDVFGLKFEETDCFDFVCRFSGIVTLNHPIYNLHAVFVYNNSDKYVVAVNSWLGPKVGVFNILELEQFSWRQGHLLNVSH